MGERSSKHRTITVDVDATKPVRRLHVLLPWYLVAGLGGLAVVAAGWLLLAAPAVLGWLTSPRAQLTGALDLANRMLLLSNGVPVEVAGQRVSIVPLGCTAVLMLLGRPLAALAARHAARSQGVSDDTGELRVDSRAIVMRVSGVFVIGYLLGLGVLATFVAGVSLPRVLLGAVLVGGLGALWGSVSALEFDLRGRWPVWLRCVPRALGVAWGICLAVGAVLLAISLYLQRDRIIAITDTLDPGTAGLVILLVLQLAYLPNLVVWATAWSLGAGLTLGDDSLISMGITDVGFLPAIPVLGAIPDPGRMPTPLWLWLLGGVLAGALAGGLVALARPARRFDETTLVGALTGVAAGFGLVLLATVASGGLGTNRLAMLGVRLKDLAITAPSLLGLSGLVVGLVVGLLRRQWPSAEEWAEWRASLATTEDPDVIDEEITRESRLDQEGAEPRPADDDEDTLPRR
ncbi:hypothetical protein EII34_03060 [Arachnia propionica]|uniref:Uncharacterized protein n=1 Tax=Arachnia propionica TaxID=1750 RepID=A0A3P1TB15_9ACTN|nr:DUF6350 family protein [Arachnia propionica]MDO5082071.1 DUF6350 family protein [Arachnia propionica]RRD06622.1 hypothetical protein EII34_03060 [Arachnia propionica]